MDDPAVFIRADLADKNAEKWESWLERTSLTFMEIVLSESLHSPEELTDFLDDLDADGLDVLEQHCTRLTFPDYPLGEEDTGVVRWHLEGGTFGRGSRTRTEGDRRVGALSSHRRAVWLWPLGLQAGPLLGLGAVRHQLHAPLALVAQMHWSVQPVGTGEELSLGRGGQRASRVVHDPPNEARQARFWR
ncbi:hypothetical protein [Streptomyces sp. NPDC055189]